MQLVISSISYWQLLLMLEKSKHQAATGIWTQAPWPHISTQSILVKPYICSHCQSQLVSWCSEKKNIYILSRKTLEIGYLSFVWLIIEYGDVIYDSCTKADSYKIKDVQLEAAQITTGCKSHTSHRQFYSELGWIKLSDCSESNKLKILYYITRFVTPLWHIRRNKKHLSKSFKPGQCRPTIYPCQNARKKLPESPFINPL